MASLLSLSGGDDVSSSFEIAQMGAGRLTGRSPHLRTARAALGIELHHPRLDHHPPRAEPPGGVALPSSAILGKGCHQLRAPASGVEPAASLSGKAADPVGVAARFADGGVHLIYEGPRARIGALTPAAGAPRANAEIFFVIACHAGIIGRDSHTARAIEMPSQSSAKMLAAGCNWRKCQNIHLATAIFFSIEKKGKFDGSGTVLTLRSTG
jgi:hypothetical protein